MPSVLRDRSPLLAGGTLALLAALSFGATAPVVARAGAGIGPLTTAALLYAGASLSALALGWLNRSNGAPLLRTQWLRLLAIALVGAGVAPTLLAWGLQRTGGTAGSLLLNLEAVFTVLLSWLAYREQIGRRVAGALTLMALGGVALTVSGVGSTHWSLLGSVAVMGATLAWALDNTLSRQLAQQNPVLIVTLKGALGATATMLLAFAFRESLPAPRAACVLLACGATGYGLSLRLYLLAQRRIGAARTGSIFALAPFVGATLGWAFGDRPENAATLAAALLFLTGLVLHLTERHKHRHVHLATEHDHPHRHDDGHHDHQHVPPFLGEHSHPHRHERMEHEHDHAPDVHHDHVHS